MPRIDDATSSALTFDDAVIALGTPGGSPERPGMTSSPSLSALRDAGSSHFYADTASAGDLAHTIGAGDGWILAEVDGNTINQPLLAKVLAQILDAGNPAAWAEALRRRRPDLAPRELTPLLYTIALALAGGDVVKRFAAGRSWEVSLQLHMSGVGEIERSVRWGRYLRAMVPTCLVKVPFAPHAPECFLIARDLEASGIPVNLTSTFSARQVAAASILSGVTRTNVFMGRLDQGLEAKRLGAHVDLESQRLLRRLRAEAGVRTQLIVASLRSWRSIVETAGCDVYTAPLDVLVGLLEQDEVAPEEMTSRLTTSYEDDLGISDAVEKRLGRARIARLWEVEHDFLEFLTEYRDSAEYRKARSGDEIAHRFEGAGFGDFFYAPSAADAQEFRRGKLPDFESPLTERVAIDTLYSLLANADFTKHQEIIDRQIAERVESAPRAGSAHAAAHVDDVKPAPRSVGEAVNRLTQEGYAGHFHAVPGPALRETMSGVCVPPEDLRVDRQYRFEGVSDPDDQAIVFALSSSDGRIRGTYTAAYGPASLPRDAEVLRRLGDPGDVGAGRDRPRPTPAPAQREGR